MLNQIYDLLAFKDNYSKVKYPGPDFLQNTSIIRNLIFTIQQATIMQVWLSWKNRESGLLG